VCVCGTVPLAGFVVLFVVSMACHAAGAAPRFFRMHKSPVRSLHWACPLGYQHDAVHELA
jgi:hypothetical protein